MRKINKYVYSTVTKCILYTILIQFLHNNVSQDIKPHPFLTNLVHLLSVLLEEAFEFLLELLGHVLEGVVLQVVLGEGEDLTTRQRVLLRVGTRRADVGQQAVQVHGP